MNSSTKRWSHGERLPEEDDIFLDGDASAICCDRMIGGE